MSDSKKDIAVRIVVGYPLEKEDKTHGYIYYGIYATSYFIAKSLSILFNLRQDQVKILAPNSFESVVHEAFGKENSPIVEIREEIYDIDISDSKNYFVTIDQSKLLEALESVQTTNNTDVFIFYLNHGGERGFGSTNQIYYQDILYSMQNIKHNRIFLFNDFCHSGGAAEYTKAFIEVFDFKSKNKIRNETIHALLPVAQIYTRIGYDESLIKKICTFISKFDVDPIIKLADGDVLKPAFEKESKGKGDDKSGLLNFVIKSIKRSLEIFNNGDIKDVLRILGFQKIKEYQFQNDLVININEDIPESTIIGQFAQSIKYETVSEIVHLFDTILAAGIESTSDLRVFILLTDIFNADQIRSFNRVKDRIIESNFTLLRDLSQKFAAETGKERLVEMLNTISLFVRDGDFKCSENKLRDFFIACSTQHSAISLNYNSFLMPDKKVSPGIMAATEFFLEFFVQERKIYEFKETITKTLKSIMVQTIYGTKSLNRPQIPVFLSEGIDEGFSVEITNPKIANVPKTNERIDALIKEYGLKKRDIPKTGGSSNGRYYKEGDNLMNMYAFGIDEEKGRRFIKIWNKELSKNGLNEFRMRDYPGNSYDEYCEPHDLLYTASNETENLSKLYPNEFLAYYACRISMYCQKNASKFNDILKCYNEALRKF